MLRKFLQQGHYRDPADQDAHLAALRDMELSGAQQYEHDHLYACLSILDRKATALLSFDSILIATSAIVLALLNKATSAGSVLIFGALVFAGGSSALNLLVISLRWTETAELSDPKRHFTHLLNIRDRRSLYYRFAWLSAVTALVLVVIGILVWRRF